MTNLQSVDGVLLDLGDEGAGLTDGVTWSQHQGEMLRDHMGDQSRGGRGMLGRFEHCCIAC